MKTKREWKWPLLFSLPITLIGVAVVWRHNHHTNPIIYAYNDAQAERLALQNLSYRLQREPDSNPIVVQYKTLNDPHVWAGSPLGSQGSEIFLYFVSYNRATKTITKRLYANLPSETHQSSHKLSAEPKTAPSAIWRWQNVDETAIHKIVGENYRVGSLYGLKEYGAKLVP